MKQLARLAAFTAASLISILATAQVLGGPFDGITRTKSGGPLGPVSFTVGTIAADDATPSVSGANVFETSANTVPTAITDLDNPTVGQVVWICGGSAVNSSTIADAGNFSLEGAVTLDMDTCIALYVRADNDYVELSRAQAPERYFVDLTVSGAMVASAGIEAPLVSTASDDLGIDSATGGMDVGVGVAGKIREAAQATDLPATSLTITAGDAAALPSVITNTTGANLVLAGGIGQKKITVTSRANAAGDAVGIVINGTTTTLTEGVGFNCLVNEATCAIALEAAIEAIAGVSASVSGAVVAVSADPDTYSLDLTYTDAAAPSVSLTLTEGTDGAIILPSVTYFGGISRPYITSSSGNFSISLSSVPDVLSIGSSINVNRRIQNSSSSLNLGKTYTATVSTTAGEDVSVGAGLEVAEELTVKGATTLNTSVRIPNQVGLWFSNTNGTNHSQFVVDDTFGQFVFDVGASHNYQMVFGTTGAKDYDHASLGYPALYLHSATDPDSDNTEWLGAWHNATNGVVTTGKGNITLAPFNNLVAAPKVTGDPCGASATNEGSFFFNDTASYFCFCDSAGADVRMHDPSSACF